MIMKSVKPTVLIVDDDKNTRDGLARALKRHYEILLAESGERALAILSNTPADVVISDVRMPGMDGLTLLQRVMTHTPQPIVMVITAYGNVETAVKAMKHGAYDFLTKPVNLDHLDILIKRALHSQKVEGQIENLHEQLDAKYGITNIIGSTPVMIDVFETIKQAAPTPATILLQGESGTGKEVAAHAIHQLSPRSKGPFIAVHCAALSPSLLESELFGHEKGAFTGATSRRMGRFEMADGGTFFLDEISEVDPAIQVKLLRVLEERTFERVGGDEPVDVDIRLIVASNRNLKELVAKGKFRNDLYYRLDVVNITMPPLRDRLNDIPVLCQHFLKDFNHKNDRQIEGIVPEVMNVFSGYAWPGNVRELRNTIEKMVVLGRGKKLTLRDIPANIRDEASDLASGSSWTGGPTPASGSIEEAEQLMIQTALKKNNGNRTKAAQEVGISRRTLHRKLKKYQLEDSAESENAESE